MSFQRLDHVLEAPDAELKAARDGVAREETNLASRAEQLVRPFQHEQALLPARRELARIERKLTGQAGTGDTAGAVLAHGRAAEEAAA